MQSTEEVQMNGVPAFVAKGVLAALLVGIGAWLTYHGLGAGGGNTSRSWATFGPLLAGLGVALAIVAVTGRGHR
ncbi:hypothetical protein CXG46_07795 [Nocardioides alpinus]|uniref:Uncharacterized protein n=1 Tax=Nocardioides alpinus TaxID=748909 RepID=A0ABX4QZ95_9ACTN|nr:hypothetical protein CXG46_07795 [Nocardioides alpinus]